MSSVGTQASDLNDGDIINATLLVPGDGAGLQKFQYKLPSGRVLESNEFSEDNRRRAILTWLDIVKQTVVEDLEETAAIARRGAMPALDDAAPVIAAAPASTTVTVSPPVDPEAWVGVQLAEAREAYNAAVVQLGAALETKKAASAALARWEQLHRAVKSPVRRRRAGKGRDTSHEGDEECAG